MKPNTETIWQLVQKLEKEGDVTPEEADGIFSIFSEDALRTRLNAMSSEFDFEMSIALMEWYKTVGKKIEKGQRGNFIFTVHLNESIHREYMYPAQKALRKHGGFEDLCSTVMINKRLCSPLPFRSLFEKTTSYPWLQWGESVAEVFYEISSPRAGMFHYPIKTESGIYTISQAMKRFSPVMKVMSPNEMRYAILRTAFEIASGVHDFPMYSWVLDKEEAKTYVVADFMCRKDIPCIAAFDIFRGGSILFTEKGKAHIVEKAMEVPSEDLIENALNRKIIDKKKIGEFFGGFPAQLPLTEFIEANREYIDGMVRLKMEKEAEKDEDTWLEQTR